MRRKIRLPRIIKVNWIEGLSVSVVFNNGESRIIDFQQIFGACNVEEGSPEYTLKDPKEFAKLELEGYTLSWKNASQVIIGLNGEELKVPYEIGPDTLYKFSKPDNTKVDYNIGHVIRKARLKSGMTQLELALKSGTTRNYISRIENDRSDIELGTLRKIIEIGLGKRMEIQIK